MGRETIISVYVFLLTELVNGIGSIADKFLLPCRNNAVKFGYPVSYGKEKALS